MFLNVLNRRLRLVESAQAGEGEVRVHVSQPRRTTILQVIGCLLGGGMCCTWCVAAAPAEIIIRLKPEAEVSEPIVRLRDVAEIRGRDRGDISRLGEIDLLERPALGEAEQLTKERVVLRLLLAGVSRRELVLAGAKATRVRAATPQPPLAENLLDEEVIDAVRDLYQASLAMPAESLVVRLMRPLPPIRIGQVSRTLTAHVSDRRKLGRIRPTIRITVGGKLQRVLTAQMEVEAIRDVVVTTAPLEAGTTIQPSDITTVRRAVTDLSLPAYEQIVGKVVRTKLAAGEHVRPNMLRQHVRDRYVLRARDSVRLVARKGNLEVTVASGEVLQNGNVGDFVRVRNPSSRKIVRGRVKNSREVEVVF